LRRAALSSQLVTAGLGAAMLATLLASWSDRGVARAATIVG
jgi:hypothetical protein